MRFNSISLTSAQTGIHRSMAISDTLARVYWYQFLAMASMPQSAASAAVIAFEACGL
jgi:hypothetical protein